METSRQAVRRSTSASPKFDGEVDLPCFELDELTDLQLDDLQVSVPMRPRLDAKAAGDRESTEEMCAADRRQQEQVTDPIDAPARVLQPTQPISLPRSIVRPARVTTIAHRGADRSSASRGQVATPASAGIGGGSLENKPPVRRTSVNVGDVLAGRYVVVDQVDHRGMGLVYKALDRHRKDAGLPVPWVALKMARPAVDPATETSACLRQEFLKLSQLNHPNIVTVFDLACDDGLDFIVMQWLSGETLASMLAGITSKRVALDKAADIVQSVAGGLAHAHELGIVHGDVKPSNIFLTDARTVKILDFGSSGTTTASDDSERNWATRAYASCEVLQGQAPQPHDDVFALGVTSFSLLSGERPFGDLDALAAEEEGASPEPLPVDAQDYWPAVRHALQFESYLRPANARVFLQEFDSRAAKAPAAAPAATRSPTVAYGALVATFLASLVWWSVQSVGGLPPDAEAALARGDSALAAGRLLEPAKNNAFAWYSEVLAAEPGNRLALTGLDQIAEEFLTRARVALREDNAEAALADVAAAKRVSPEHFGIPVIEDLIASHGREFLVRARGAVENDIGRAEQFLLQAANLLPADDPQLARVRDELARQKVDNQVDGLLRRIDDRILAERLTLPRGDSAVDLLQTAKELAPDDRRISLAANRIMTALLFQAMFAISNGDLNDAEHFIGAARALGIEHLALARAEYELAKARRDALTADR